jgi:L-malate glycosyltransferase
VTPRLTILHLASEMNAAGSTVSIVLLARAQQREGHRVSLGCPAGSALSARGAAAGLDVVPVDFTAPDAAERVAALAAARAADVVNAHASRDRAACRRARWAGRLPQALVMTRRVMPRSSWLSSAASGYAADRVIAVSRPVARALVRRLTPPSRIRVVANAVDWERLAPAPPAAAVARARELSGWAAGRPTVGVVARRKRQDVALKALGALRLPVTLVCVGIEPDATLRALAAAAEARGHVVRFVPFEPDVRPFYALFDAALLPSATEGCSQALLEAMALGVPVVAARAGGNTDVVTDGVTGLLPRLHAASIARALARVLLDRDLAAAMAQAARRRVLDAFDVARVTASTDAVYREAIARRRAG